MEYNYIIESVAKMFESAGVFIMVLGAIIATAAFLSDWLVDWSFRKPFTTLRQNLGRSILLGLDFLIIGDIIGTIIVSTTLYGVIVLAFIIGIRFFLGMELEHRISGHWPWEREK